MSESFTLLKFQAQAGVGQITVENITVENQ